MQKRINLALQGGGAHGAYSWGVLDRLLEEKNLIIEGVSGTSAGAMNAAIMANGFVVGGREGAKEKLHDFWLRVSEVGVFSPLSTNPLSQLMTGWNLDYSPFYYWLDMLSRLFSPYEINPFNFNPLKGILEATLDVEALQACSLMQVFVAATHVESGQARVFGCDELTVDVLLASACIPFMFQAQHVEGEYYWDGGYMGNPAIWPLIYHCECEDVLLVQINPIHRKGVPKTALEIINRLNEITFNSSLIAEIRAIEFVSRLLRENRLSREEYKDIKMHLIYSPLELTGLNASSKLNASWAFFTHLRDIGREATDAWLGENQEHIGVRSSVDIRQKFLCGAGKYQEVSDLIRKKSARKQQVEVNVSSTAS